MTDSRPLAIVTGASRGIGRAISEHLAQRGYDLVLCYHSKKSSALETQELCASHGAEVCLFQGDIGLSSSAETICQMALENFGRIDGIVCNAGLALENLLATSTDDEILRVIQTNILGSVCLARAVLRPMIKRRKGSLVFVSSIAATRPARGNSIYAGTKGFLEAFARGLAVEVGSKGLRVNCVAPGVVDTEMTAGILAVAGETIEQRIGLRRIAQSSEIAEVVGFLISDASSYVSGTTVAVDGAFG